MFVYLHYFKEQHSSEYYAKYFLKNICFLKTMFVYLQNLEITNVITRP